MESQSNLVYLARPIDFTRAEPELIEFTIGQLQATATPSYDPLNAFNVSGFPTGVIQRVNESAMDASSGGVAFLPSTAISIGVPSEISYLLNRFKPVVIVTDINKSWVMAGWKDKEHCKLVPMTEEGVTEGVEWLIETMAAHSLLNFDNQPITFGREHPDAILPTRGYETDAGYDLYTVGDHEILPGEFVDVPCGVSVDLPEGTWGMITGRSSTLRKRGLLVSQGVIDEEYTGPLYAGVQNLKNNPVVVKNGERVAQFILHLAPGQDYTPNWGTPRQKTRGSNGFGSTGL